MSVNKSTLSSGSSDKPDDWLGRLTWAQGADVSLVNVCCLLLHLSADLTDQDDHLTHRVFKHELECLPCSCTREGVTTETVHGRLAKTEMGSLRCELVRDGPGTSCNSHRSWSVDMERLDTELDLLMREDHPGTVGTDDTRLVLGSKDALDLELFLCGNTLGVCDDQRDLRLDTLDDRVCCSRWRNKDRRNARLEGFDSFTDGVEHWLAEEFLAALLWCCCADNVGSPLLGDGAVGLRGLAHTQNHDWVVLLYIEVAQGFFILAISGESHWDGVGDLCVCDLLCGGLLAAGEADGFGCCWAEVPDVLDLRDGGLLQLSVSCVSTQYPQFLGLSSRQFHADAQQ